MMTGSVRILAGVLFLLLSGCSYGLQEFSASVAYGPFWKAEKSAYFEQLANQYEKSMDPHRAIECLEIARHLTPGNTLLTLKIDQLKKSALLNAKQHLKKATLLSARSRPARAKIEYLKALINDPLNEKALGSLKKLTAPPVFRPYRVKQGDTPGAIASKVYNDSQMGFMIGLFNDLPEKGGPKPGTVLSLPIVEKEPHKKKHIAKDPIMQAEALYKHKAYAQALSMARAALEDKDTNDAARDLTNRIYIKMGEQRIRDREYARAEKILLMVTPGYAGRDAALASIENAIQTEDLDRDLEAARTFLENRQYREMLALLAPLTKKGASPEIVTALQDDAWMGMARQLFKEKKDLEALEAALHIVRKDARQLVDEIKTRLHDRAEGHYRNGVKFFINEELKKAIEEWEITLKLMPEHIMAKENIHKTRRLLLKINKIQ